MVSNEPGGDSPWVKSNFLRDGPVFQYQPVSSPNLHLRVMTLGLDRGPCEYVSLSPPPSEESVTGVTRDRDSPLRWTGTPPAYLREHVKDNTLKLWLAEAVTPHFKEAASNPSKQALKLWMAWPYVLPEKDDFHFQTKVFWHHPLWFREF